MVIAANAKADWGRTSPGRLMSWLMARGIVVEPLRDRNEVAPNSPSDTAAHNPLALRIAGVKSGMSIRIHVRSGLAPSDDAAKRSSFGIACAAGTST